MRWTLVVRETNAPTSGRRSRVVLMPRRWRQLATMLRIARGWWQESPITRESAKEAVKTIRAGKAGSLRRTCGDYARVLIFFRTRGCGCCPGIRLSLRPLFLRDTVHEQLGRDAPRECKSVSGCLKVKSGNRFGAAAPNVAAGSSVFALASLKLRRTRFAI